ncbi:MULTISPECIES: methyltransferase domain-containing protein [Streptomyces]|uniref:class I SAM-dependent methyltransferase n=1 Tax=Streptomyces TaxID=1883 RepID=UPI002E187018|nr:MULTISPECIES: methyltransferase domain-containing protein [unclassified Streptomyces]
MPHIVNVDQSHAWNGYEGEHWARNHDRWDAVNEGFNQPLLDAAAVRPGERVLDVGCGAGATTRLAARRAGPGGRALGVDLSGPMLARAEETARREGAVDVSFERGDAQIHPFPAGAFDVAISRFGVMFFADPVAAFINIRRALRPGGRLAFICAAEPERNDWLRAVAGLRGILPVGDFGTPGERDASPSPGMFSLADPDATREVLSGAGFAGVEVRRVEGYGPWGRDAGDAAAFLLGSGPGRHLTEQVDGEARELAHRTLTNTLHAYERVSEGIADGKGEVRMKSVGFLVTAHNPEEVPCPLAKTSPTV